MKARDAHSYTEREEPGPLFCPVKAAEHEGAKSTNPGGDSHLISGKADRSKQAPLEK